MRTVSWKPGFASLHNGADAQKVADEIAAIGEAILPEQIVERARDTETELHKCFTWDDKEAADKWRLHEARQIVCHLVYTDDEKPEVPPLRCMVQAEGPGYKKIEYVRRNVDEYAAMLGRAYGELQAFRAKYKTLSELEPVLNAIDEVLSA